jgi:hypothetical protein
MAARIKEKVLAEKLGTIRKVKEWSPGLMAKLEASIRESDDYALFRINPLHYAAENGAVENEVIDLFLHATKAGLFQMEWNLVCPSCGDSVESFRSLSKLNSHFYCTVCDLNSEATLDDFIQVAFTISPEVRGISYHHPEALTIEDFHLKYHFNQGARLPDGPRFIEAIPTLVKGLSYLGPGQKKRFEVETAGGSLTFNDLIHHLSVAVQVDGAPAVRPQLVSVRVEGARIAPEPATVAPGKVQFTVENKTAVKAALEMNKEIARFNRALTSKDVILKIGIHKGPCIAVTLNDRLDYFGQTVNTAARVQGLAGSEEIYITDDVFAFQGVKGLLKGYKVFGGRVKLKGIQDEAQVYKITAGAGNGG